MASHTASFHFMMACSTCETLIYCCSMRLELTMYQMISCHNTPLHFARPHEQAGLEKGWQLLSENLMPTMFRIGHLMRLLFG